MNYSNLTTTQRRCIDAFVKIRPELATQETITRTEVENLFKTLYSDRKNSGVKVGYPMWLVKGDKVSRGVYVFPSPKSAVKTSKSKSVTTPVFETNEDKEFFQDLQKYGIESKQPMVSTQP